MLVRPRSPSGQERSRPQPRGEAPRPSRPAGARRPRRPSRPGPAPLDMSRARQWKEARRGRTPDTTDQARGGAEPRRRATHPTRHDRKAEPLPAHHGKRNTINSPARLDPPRVSHDGKGCGARRSGTAPTRHARKAKDAAPRKAQPSTQGAGTVSTHQHAKVRPLTRGDGLREYQRATHPRSPRWCHGTGFFAAPVLRVGKPRVVAPAPKGRSPAERGGARKFSARRCGGCRSSTRRACRTR